MNNCEPVVEYAKSRGLVLDDVIDELVSGELKGKKCDGVWYVDTSIPEDEGEYLEKIAVVVIIAIILFDLIFVTFDF